MSRSNPWYALVPLCLGITACTESSPPAAPTDAPSTPATTTAAMGPAPAEPTFEIIPTPSELVAVLKASLRDPVDTAQETQALQEVESELGGFAYAPPNTMVGVDPNVEAPMGHSYIQDSEWAAARVKALYGPDMTVSCLSRPCIHYGDFDGDGQRDLVVQVAEDVKDKAGIAFLLANQTHALLGAGRPSPVGDDLLWVDSWQVVPHSSGKGKAVVLTASAQTARVELSADAGPGGSHTVNTGWACMASSQVPVMAGPSSPGGLVTRSGSLDGSGSFEAWHVFDADSSSLWISESWTSEAVWVGYEWSSPRFISRYALTFNNGSLTTRAPRDFSLQGWNGSTWVTLDSRTGELQWAGKERRLYTVSNPGAYGKYRLFITNDNDDRAPIVALSLERLELIGGDCAGGAAQAPSEQVP